MKIAFTTLILFISTFVFSQAINQFDANGNRHGIWKKTFDKSSVLRYEGEFLHGKEIGLFKFYINVKNKAVLSATKEFNEKDNRAYVKFLASNGKVISEGTMDAKKYVGVWKYYQNANKELLTLENYTDEGLLNGERFIYYLNGQVAEKQFYKNGLKHGVFIGYSDKNVVLEELIYVNDELHGYAKYYSPMGELVIEGNYKRDKKEGIWKYYENGKLIEEKNLSYAPKYIKKTP